MDHFPKVGVKMKNIWVATSQLHLGCQVIKARKWILVGIIHYYSLIKADQLPSIHTDDQLISNHGKPGAERTHWTKTWVSKITLVTFLNKSQLVRSHFIVVGSSSFCCWRVSVNKFQGSWKKYFQLLYLYPKCSECMDDLPTFAEKWPHSRGNVGKYSLREASGIYLPKWYFTNRFPWNKGSHFPSKKQPFWGPRSFEVAIIWPDLYVYISI